MYVLSRLPSSLILSFLISICLTNFQSTASHVTGADFLARAAPLDIPEPELFELSPDTFNKTISEGYWFIEHFSPFCGHCRRFAPTWKTLVNDAKTEIPHVSMATVNCAVHGDLCDENGVSGYPEMKLYKSGELVKTFHGERDLPTLKKFLQDNAPPTPPPSPPSVEKPVEKPVEKALESELGLPTLNPDGQVDPLNPSTFDSVLAKGPMFVKFFAPWCGHCKKLAPIWAELAKKTQNGHVTIAEVNCEDHVDLCKSHNIEGYPSLVFFGNDKRTTEYKSGRKLGQLLSFVEKASAPSLRRLKSFDDLHTRVKEYDVVYLLLFPTRPPKDVFYALKDAASPLLGQPPVFYTSNPELVHHYGVSSKEPWALVALKDHEANTASSTFLASHIANTPDASSLASSQHIRDPTSQLSTWLRTHRLPTSLELTQDTFQSVMNAPEEPLVVIAAAPPVLKPAVEKRIQDLVAMWKTRTGGTGRVKPSNVATASSSSWAWIGSGESVRGERGEREVLLTWMDAERWKDWIKGMYGLAAVEGVDALADVPLVIVDHKRLIYWDRDSQDNQLILSKRILDVVQDVVDGKIGYKHSESNIERLARTLSNGLVGIEHFIAEHMFMSLMFVVGGFMVVFWIAKRFVSSEVNQAYKRVERLD